MKHDPAKPDPLATCAMPAEKALASAGLETSPYSAADTGANSGSLEVRCPNCRMPIQVAADTSFTELTCDVCGSQFSLVDQTEATRMAPALSKMGRFELIERIGVGGYGTVWKARDRQLDRTVAVKVPRQVDMNAADTEIFFKEARTAAQLRHPNIVSVHEVGRDGDTVYIVSDFVRGVTLGDWLTSQKITSREAAELTAKIANALQHAHDHGVVHRDLKPANIMIDGEGEPHLMDFGLARREVGEITVTMDGQVLGTPAYMSPEQAQGEAHSADRRSDVYSLGVILFQLLTGELPFRGNARMIMHQVINDEPPTPRKLNANISKDLETITLKCLEKSPDRRYQSAREVAEELRRYIGGEPIKARPVGRLERGWRWCRRYPVVTSLWAAIALSLAAGTLVSSILYVRAEGLRKLEAEARVQSETDRRRAIDAEAIAQGRQRSAYFANMRLAQDALDRNEFESARASLERCPEALRQWEWNCLNWQLDQSLATAHDHASYATSLVMTPDGRRILTGSLDQSVRSWDPSGKGPAAVIADTDATVRDIAISSDSRWLAIARRDGPIEVWDFAQKQRVHTLKGHNSESCAVAFSPNGNLIASGGGAVDQTLRIWDWRNEKELAACTGHLGRVWTLAFSPDGRSITSGGYDSKVRTWDAMTGKQLGDVIPMADLVNCVSYSPDGKKLAAACNDSSVAVWSTDSRTQLFVIKPHGDDVNGVAFSPDGKLLASASKDGTIHITNAETGASLNRLFGHTESVIDVAFSPTGQQLASCGRAGEVKLWDPRAISIWHAAATDPRPRRAIEMLEHQAAFLTTGASGIERLRLTGAALEHNYANSSRRTSGLTVSRDGTLLAFAADNVIVVMDVLTGRIVQEIKAPSSILDVAISPDNERIYAGGKESKFEGREEFLVYAFEIGDGKPLWQTPGHRYWIYAVGLRPDGEQLWTSGDDLSIFVWDTATGKLLRKLNGPSRSVWGIKFSSDGKLAASGDSGGVVILWDAMNGQRLWSLRGDQGNIYDLAFHPTQPRLASLGSDHTLRIWDTGDGAELMKSDVCQRHRDTGQGITAVGAADWTQLLRPLRDFVKGQPNRPAGNSDPSEAERIKRLEPISLAFSPDGSTLLVGDRTGGIWYWYTSAPSGGFPSLR